MYSNLKPGLDHYWRELSYETINLVGSNAAGWFVLPHLASYYNPSGTIGGTDLLLLAADCTAAADASVNFALFTGINMVFNVPYNKIGIAYGGRWHTTLDSVTKFWSCTWEISGAYLEIFEHEMGHGFGLPHSSGAYGATYDNAWDVMSLSYYNCDAAFDPTYGCLAQHTICYHKDILGWIPAGQKFIAGQNTNTEGPCNRPGDSQKRMVCHPGKLWVFRCSILVELSFLEPDRIGQEIAFHRFNGKSTLQAHAGGCTHPGIIRVD
jgi:hypothetical protein